MTFAYIADAEGVYPERSRGAEEIRFNAEGTEEAQNNAENLRKKPQMNADNRRYFDL